MKTLLTAALAAGIACSPLAALAQDASPARFDEACRAELTGICASTADKRGAGFRCLVDNQVKLGPSCASAVKATQERRAALQAACKADADKLCGAEGDTKGGVRVACLRTKTTELSKPCADAIAALPQGSTRR